MRTLGARDGSTRRVSLRQRLIGAVALSVAAASVVIVGASAPAFATVSGVSVTTVRAAAGATTNYTVVFTTTVALTANVDSITLVGPVGTVFPAAAGAYTVGGTAVSATPVVGPHAVTIVTHSPVAAGSVTVIASGVVNPAAGPQTMSVATSKEATSVASGTYVISAATAVTPVTVSSVVPPRALVSNATYTIHFTAATALVENLDTITIAAPPGTAFPLIANSYSVQVGGTAQTVLATPTQTAANNVTLSVPTNSTGGTAPISGIVIASNVTNPPTASASETLAVSTSEDSAAGTSANYAITAATAVTGPVTATPVPTTTGVAATYTVGFNVTTALVSGDTITLTGPAGTTFPATPGNYSIGGTTVTAAVVRTAGNSTVTITTLNPVSTGPLSVVATGVINPPDGIDTLSVSTSADGVLVPSGSYTITSSVTGVTVVPSPANPAAVATYTVSFVASTALLANLGTITIAGPLNTVFPAAANSYTVGGVLVTALPVRSALNATVTITAPVNVAVNPTSTAIVITGVTNPGAGSPVLSLATSSDTVAANSSAYTITGVAALQVSALIVTPSPTTTLATSTYTVGFTATTLVNSGGTITLATPGMSFPATASGAYTVKDGAGATTTVAPGTAASVNTITITTPVTLTAGVAVQVVITGLANPAAGPYTMSVATSGDTTALASPFYSITAVVTGGGGGATTPATPVRLAGADRFGTAIVASQVEYPTSLSAGAVVLARSDDYPDALVGTAFATARNAPLLFANGGALTPGTVAEIQRVLPAGGTVYLLGGLAAIPASVATTLTGLGFVPVRYAGADRFGTALAVADALGDPSTVLLATGINFPDALAAGPAAAHVSGVVLLTNGTALTPAVQAYLTGHAGKVYAIGGPAVAADPAATPLSGADRYGTAAAVAVALFTAPNIVGVASGTQFPDALSGGAFQGHFGGPILLTDPGVLPTSTSTYLGGAKTTIVTTNIFGGTAALSTAVQASISTALGL